MAIMAPPETLTATLTIREGKGKRQAQFGHVEADLPSDAESIAAKLGDLFSGSFYSGATSDSTLTETATKFTKAVLPQNIESAIGSWHSHGNAVLVVQASKSMADLPWELLSIYFGSGLFVVRHGGSGSGSESGSGSGVEVRTLDPAAVTKIVAAGWKSQPGGGQIDGIDVELTNLAVSLPNPDFEVISSREQRLVELGKLVTDEKADVLHLAIASGFRVDLTTDITELTLFPNSDQPPPTDDDLIALLADSDSPALVICNAMPNPVVAALPFYRKLCEQLGVAVVGWGGALQDHIAVDFASYWYQRITEGFSIVEATRSFAAQFGHDQWVAGAVPVIWVPSEAWLDMKLIDRAPVRTFTRYDPTQAPMGAVIDVEQKAPPISIELPEQTSGIEDVLESVIGDSVDRDVTPAPATARVAPAEATPTSAPAPALAPAPAPAPASLSPDVSIRFDVQKALFPALLINDTVGQPVEAFSVHTNRDFAGRIEIECDVGSGRSAHRRTQNLLAGQNTIDLNDVQFPVLYDLVGSTERRKITFTASVYRSTELLAQQTKATTWYSRRDWLNNETSWPFIAAYVLPMSAAVAEIVAEAQGVLRQIGKPSADFAGYPLQGGDQDQVDDQIQAIFQAVRARSLRYIAPPGLPLYVYDPRTMEPEDDPLIEITTSPGGRPSDAVSVGQIVRTPVDVLARGHGTCHDLALLLAAVTEYVNLRPLVILMEGHTYFGYWRDATKYRDFWAEQEQRPTTARHRPWTFSANELAKLHKDLAVEVLEANMMTKPFASFLQAQTRATQYLGGPLKQVVDIHRARQWVQPLSLQ